MPYGLRGKNLAQYTDIELTAEVRLLAQIVTDEAAPTTKAQRLCSIAVELAGRFEALHAIAHGPSMTTTSDLVERVVTLEKRTDALVGCMHQVLMYGAEVAAQSNDGRTLVEEEKNLPNPVDPSKRSA